jgi:hypothetical protein
VVDDSSEPFAVRLKGQIIGIRQCTTKMRDFAVLNSVGVNSFCAILGQFLEELKSNDQRRNEVVKKVKCGACLAFTAYRELFILKLCVCFQILQFMFLCGHKQKTSLELIVSLTKC